MQGLASSQELTALDVFLDFVALLGKTQGHLDRLKVVPKLKVYASAWARVNCELALLPQKNRSREQESAGRKPELT